MDSAAVRLLVILIVTILSGHISTNVTAHQISKPQTSATVAFLKTLTNGTVSGKVTHGDGVTPINGATVKALQGTTTVATTTTTATGDYTLSDLAAGSYRIEASATGFGTKTQFPVTVSEAANTTVNLKLDEIVPGPVSYIYDAAGRLVAAVGPTDATIYVYDAAGNLLSISRQPSSQLSILSVVPNRGSVGQAVTIYGSGFSGIPAENNVQFNGVSSVVLSASSTRVVTTVPALAVTGQIQIAVTTSQGTATAPFTVLPASSEPAIQVAPSYISILPGETVQFVASVTGISGNQSLTWSVNGVNGGNTIVGTISSSGFYTAPFQSPSIFSIRATSVANPAIFGQAQVAIFNPTLAEAPIASAISVFRQGAVPTAVQSGSVAVRRNVANPVAPITRVSVRRLAPTDVVAPTASRVSVRRTDALVSASTQSAGLSLTKGPIVQSVAPGSAAKNTSLTFTITGVNFDGATGLSFLTTGGLVDSAITASNISVNAEGTSLTATVTISAGAALGQRIVIVVTPGAHSIPLNVGPNIVEITQ